MTPDAAPVSEVEVLLEDTAEFPAVPPSVQVPFRCRLSLEPLIAFWEREAAEDVHGLAETARRLLRDLEVAPDLRGDDVEREALDRHPDLVRTLLSVVLPPGLARMSCAAAVVPFGNDYFAMSPRFRSVFCDAEGRFAARMQGGSMSFAELKVLFSHVLILRALYGRILPFTHSIHGEVTEPATGLEAIYQLRVHLEYVQVRPVGDLPPLDEDLLARLEDHVTDVELWRRLLPSDRFEFSGFMVHEATEVTPEVSLSRLKQLLLAREPFLDADRYRRLEGCLRNLFRIPDMRLFIAVLQGGDAYFLHPDPALSGRTLAERVPCLTAAEVRVLQEEGVLRLGGECSVGEFRCSGGNSRMEGLLGRFGLTRALVASLVHGEEEVGFVVFATPGAAPGGAAETLSLDEVLALFATAVHNNTEAVRERVQAVIKENFTAIHPTVEWRFRQAALNFLKHRETHPEIEPIVFTGVYPLYGVSDIRHSSDIRSRAIQADLQEQLRLAQGFLESAYRHDPLPYVAHLSNTVGRALDSIAAAGLASGQETTLLEFLRREVEPLFPVFEGDDEVARAVRAYRDALDPELRVLYRCRKEFEDSLGRVRELVGSILLEEQERAQAIFPHYFEMHKTDGVDHMIYAGESLSERAGFRDFHLKSLRIWQLEAMCRVVRETERLKEDLVLPLGTAHLVLVQEMPLAIRFMMDDRRFDVDGAYNARYEIVKKRLDKAEIRGTGERLTQPGHLAVVYSQPREAAEYRDYLQFLADRGDVVGEVERHELGDLQGVYGLRALRVRVSP